MKQTNLTSFFKKDLIPPNQSAKDASKYHDEDSDVCIIPDTPDRHAPTKPHNPPTRLTGRPNFPSTSNNSSAKKKRLSLLRKRTKAHRRDGMNYCIYEQDISSKATSVPQPTYCNTRESSDDEVAPVKRSKYMMPKVTTNVSLPEKPKTVDFSNDELDALSSILVDLRANEVPKTCVVPKITKPLGGKVSLPEKPKMVDFSNDELDALSGILGDLRANEVPKTCVLPTLTKPLGGKDDCQKKSPKISPLRSKNDVIEQLGDTIKSSTLLDLHKLGEDEMNVSPIFKSSSRNSQECKRQIMSDCLGLNDNDCKGIEENIEPTANILPQDGMDFGLTDSFCEYLDSSFTEEKKASDAVSKRFERCRIKQIHRERDFVILDLENTSDASFTKLRLDGFWCDTPLAVDDVCHVIDPNQTHLGEWTVDDSRGFLVVRPDLLVSPTTVVSSLGCLRRSVLQHYHGSCERGGNKAMLVGSLVHILFQETAKKENPTLHSCRAAAERLLRSQAFLEQMYEAGVNEADVTAELDIYVPRLLDWIKTHRGKRGVSRMPQLEEVVDIEENIWSSQFGIKGKIDLTVKVCDNGESGRTRIIPMELKTGKTSFSSEHIGQVMLYTLMLTDRRYEEVDEGWLVYLKDGQSKLVRADNSSRRGLIQLRNRFVDGLRSVLQPSDPSQEHLQLPEVITNKRWCSWCPQMVNCGIYGSEPTSPRLPPGHPLTPLLKEAMAHLSSSHVNFLLQWTRLLLFEYGDEERKGEAIMAGIVEAGSKDCIRATILSQTVTHGSSYCMTFKLTDNSKPVTNNIFSVGEPVVISSDDGGHIALTTGCLVKVTHDIMEVISERSLLTEHGPFRMDKYPSNKIMQINMGNLSSLMANTPVSSLLRQSIVDFKPPVFQRVLSKSTIQKIKPLMKKLNMAQRTAVLKVLMAEDYVLIKGYPGSGKTSTIVALIRVLIALGLRVLLTGYTHSSVDNVLVKLKQEQVDFLRLGRREKVHDELKEYCFDEKMQDIESVKALKVLVESKLLVATTCLSCNQSVLTHTRFDVVLVDEAGQVVFPTSLGPLLLLVAEEGSRRKGKFVLVGDSNQLPPLVRSEQARSGGLDSSLLSILEREGGGSACCELNLQYRMNEVILRLCNQLIYKGAIKCASQEVASATLASAALEVTDEMLSWERAVFSPLLKDSVVFLDTSKLEEFVVGEKRGVENLGEANLVVRLVGRFIELGVSPELVGVVAPYRNQVTLIQSLLPSSCPVEVNTVDQYQGRDKSLLLVSFTRSKRADDEETRILVGDILHDIRRLNVAITRAKHKLILIGCRDTLTKYEPLSRLFEILSPDQILMVSNHHPSSE